MKLFFQLSFFILLYLGSYAQNGIKLYLDKDKQQVENPENAAFYRIISYTESGKPLGMVYDYYLSGKLQFQGMLSQVQPDKYEGNCIWYYTNGNKQREAYYLNGQPAARMAEWNEDGKILYEGTFRNGKQWGRHIFWDENGNFSQVGFYHDGKQFNITDLLTAEPESPADTRQTLSVLSEAMDYRFLKDAADAFAFNNFGQIMFEQRKYAQALCLYFVSKEIREVLAVPAALKEVNANIAAVYTATGDTKTAEIYYKKAGVLPNTAKPEATENGMVMKPNVKDRNKVLAAYGESINLTEELLREKKQEASQHTLLLEENTKTEIAETKPGNNVNDMPSALGNTATSFPTAVVLAEPIVTTLAPVVAPDEPIVTTLAPVVAPDEPIVTTLAPAVAPAEPAVTTLAPTVAPAEPAVTTSAPVIELSEPTVASSKPAAAPSAPVVEPVETTIASLPQPSTVTMATPPAQSNTPVETTSSDIATTAKAAPALLKTAPVAASIQLPGQQQLIAALEQYFTSQDKTALLQTLSEQMGVNIGSLNLQDAKAIGTIIDQMLASGAYTGVTAAFDINSATIKNNKNPESQAVILQGLAQAYAGEQRYPQALAAYEQTAKITRNKPQLAAANTAALTGMAQVYRAGQDFTRAAATLEEIKSNSEKAGNDATLALAHNELGKIAFDSGNYDAAIGHFKQAAEYYEYVANRAAVAAATNAAGAMLTVKGSYAEAQNQYKQAKSLAERLKLNKEIAAINNNTGVLYHMQGNFSDALAQYRLAFDAWTKENNPSAALPALLNMAVVNADMGNYREAYRLYQQVEELVEQVGGKLPDEPVQLSMKKTETALLQATDLAVQLSEPDVAFTLAARHKNNVAARLMLQPGAETVSAGLTPALKAEEIYWQQNIAALQKQGLQPQNAGKQQQLQATLQTMQTGFGQFKDKLKVAAPGYAQLKYPDDLGIEQIQQVLAPDETLLQYAVTEKKVYLFAIAKSVYQCFPLETSAVLETEVMNLLQLFNTAQAGSKDSKKTEKKTPETFVQAASKLYKKLLSKADESGFTASGKLIIIPDAFLHTLPFGLLLPGVQEEQQYKDYNFLTKAHAICYYPSVQAFYLQRTVSNGNILPGGGLLAVANATLVNARPAANTPNPSYFDMASDNFSFSVPALEADDIKTVIAPFDASGTLLLQQNQASEAKLKQVNWQKYRYLHLGVPLLLNSRYPQFSGFALSGAQNGAGLLSLSKFAAMQPKAEMVVLPFLAAQETALPAYTGNELFTLQYSFMQNGIPAALMALWQLPAKDANRFVAAFYRKLSEGKSKTDALQATQQEFIQAAETEQPFYWGGFVLYGQ
ncbi:CHAT domain-containing protein [Sphingobacteriales bacterium UPWRP_1]|nr:hypothetical protein B6N25_07295 [Sphingobacteriales bacterium TSM_CSS]PSJ78699.1 CHAT domain-containing protein [Sphingobacteriales bacterium UPWRP_1]